MHGFALNVCGDLSAFDQITPCGITNVTMTSIERETRESISVRDVAVEAERIVCAALENLREPAIV
jgi:lipoyl(octanoyl) transferase